MDEYIERIGGREMMSEALVARIRYRIQKANFMGLKDAESTLLLGEDAIEELQKKYDGAVSDNKSLCRQIAELAKERNKEEYIENGNI